MSLQSKFDEALNRALEGHMKEMIENMSANMWYERHGISMLSNKRLRVPTFRPWYDEGRQGQQWTRIGVAMPFKWIDDSVAWVRRTRRAIPYRVSETLSVARHGIPECDE